MPRAFLVKRFGNPRDQNDEINNNIDTRSLCDSSTDTSSNDSKLLPVLPRGLKAKEATAHQVGNILSRIVLDDYEGAPKSSVSGSEDGSLDLEKFELLDLENESDSSTFSECSSTFFPLEELEEGCYRWKEGLASSSMEANGMKYILQQHASHSLKKDAVECSDISRMTDQGIDLKPQFQCNQCDKTFKTKYTLNIHRKMPSHTTLKPFVCPTCGKGFRLSSTLCRHKIIHTSQRPHRCNICQKSFNRSSTLKTHLRTHSTEKEFSCQMCGKGFHQKGNLRNHVLIHTGEKPYECSVCKKSFNKLSNLKFHMHSHTDQKPYRCRFCKQTFCKRGELKLHISHCKKATNPNS